MTNPPGMPYEPYRAGSTGAPLQRLSSTPRWVYLVLVVLSCLGFLGSVGLWTGAALASNGKQPDEALFMAGGVVLGLTILLVYAYIFVGLYWLYTVWEWLPAEQRYTRHWKSWITPVQASLFLLIPYFHYYWMFVVNCGLCDAIDRMRVSHPTSEPAPKGIAIAAGICQLVVPLPVGAIMWLVFMSKIERLTQEMSVSPAYR